MKLFIILACFVAVGLADRGKKAMESKNPICSKELSVKPTDCCPNMPSFKQHFEKCATECNKTSTADPTVTTAAPKRGRGERGSGNREFFKCVMPCVIQSAGILGADGNISSDLLTQQLLNGASAEWTPIVSSVVSACFANTTAKAQRKAKAGRDRNYENQSSNGVLSKTSEKINGMIMKCTFKNLYAACPAPVDSTDCKELNEKMSQCDHEGRAGKKGGKKEKKGKGKKTEEADPEM